MKKGIIFALLIIVIALVIVFWFIPAEIRAPTGTNGTSTATTTATTTPVIADVIVSSPAANSIIKSPLTITGTARGYYFEASFPIVILDGAGKQIGQGIAQAQSDWMTAEPVAFKSIVSFSVPTTATGTIVFKNDNPSGLPEHDKSTIFPVRFK